MHRSWTSLNMSTSQARSDAKTRQRPSRLERIANSFNGKEKTIQSIFKKLTVHIKRTQRLQLKNTLMLGDRFHRRQLMRVLLGTSNIQP